MMDVFRRQVTRFGTRFISGAVTKCASASGPSSWSPTQVIKARISVIGNRGDS